MEIGATGASGSTGPYPFVRPVLSVYVSNNPLQAYNNVRIAPFDTILTDTTNSFNPTTYVYTPPVAGYYLVSAHSGFIPNPTKYFVNIVASIYKNGIGITGFTGIGGSATSAIQDMSLVKTIYCNGTTDTIALYTAHKSSDALPAAIDELLVRGLWCKPNRIDHMNTICDI